MMDGDRRGGIGPMSAEVITTDGDLKPCCGAAETDVMIMDGEREGSALAGGGEGVLAVRSIGLDPMRPQVGSQDGRTLNFVAKGL